MNENLNTGMNDFFDSKNESFPAIDVQTIRRPLKILMKPAISVTIDQPVNDAIRLMQTKRLGCVLVTSNAKLLGIFTERDVLKKILGVQFDLSTTPITEVMTTNPQFLYEDDTIAYALNYMDLGGYRHIPIVNAKLEPVGLVSIKDIVSYVIQHFADEILHLPPHPALRVDESAAEPSE